MELSKDVWSIIVGYLDERALRALIMFDIPIDVSTIIVDNMLANIDKLERIDSEYTGRVEGLRSRFPCKKYWWKYWLGKRRQSIIQDALMRRGWYSFIKFKYRKPAYTTFTDAPPRQHMGMMVIDSIVHHEEITVINAVIVLIESFDGLPKKGRIQLIERIMLAYQQGDIGKAKWLFEPFRSFSNNKLAQLRPSRFRRAKYIDLCNKLKTV